MSVPLYKASLYETCQIGQDKVLTISRLRQEDLPPPGETLSRSKLKVILRVVGKCWKREDVRREYDKLAAKRGAPTWLLTDGAVELHETADALDKHAEGSLLKWAEMVSFHLSDSDSKARAEITAERMNQKLGWLGAFRKDLARWSECHAVMKHCLNHLEHHAVEQGTVTTLRLSLQEKYR